MEKVFSRPNSVFAPWVEDTPASDYLACTADMRYWKIPRFIKDTQDVREIRDFTMKQFPKLKVIFNWLISGSIDYPNINMVSWGRLSRPIFDQNVTPSVID